jgi:hypothetical protein
MLNMILGFLLDQGVKLALQFGVPYAVNYLFSIQKWGIGPWLQKTFPNLGQMITDLINQLEAAAGHPTPASEKQKVMKRAQVRLRGQMGMPADTKGLD